MFSLVEWEGIVAIRCTVIVIVSVVYVSDIICVIVWKGSAKRGRIYIVELAITVIVVILLITNSITVKVTAFSFIKWKYVNVIRYSVAVIICVNRIQLAIVVSISGRVWYNHRTTGQTHGQIVDAIESRATGRIYRHIRVNDVGLTYVIIDDACLKELRNNRVDSSIRAGIADCDRYIERVLCPGKNGKFEVIPLSIEQLLESIQVKLECFICWPVSFAGHDGDNTIGCDVSDT